MSSNHTLHAAHDGPARVSRWHLARLPILAGPLRGTRWLPASGGKLLRVMMGTYEREQSALYQQTVKDGDVVFDVGAAVGYYTLFASKLVGRRGHVVAFEPEPTNFGFLSKHVDANRLTNVTVHQSAVGGQQGTARFTRGTGTGTGHLSDNGDIEVPVCKIDDLVASQRLHPTHMKIDVEGAEVDVLNGARTTLESDRPTLFLSTHGKPVHDACCRLLKELDYNLTPILGTDLETTSEVFCRAA